MVIYGADDQLIQVCGKEVMARDSYHVEALAMLEAYTWLQTQQGGTEWRGATVVSDCIAVVQAMQHKSLDGFPSWQAMETLQQME
jgi:hypothetical protein